MPKTLQTMCKTYFVGSRIIVYGFWRRKNPIKKTLCLFSLADTPPSCLQDKKEHTLFFLHISLIVLMQFCPTNSWFTQFASQFFGPDLCTFSRGKKAVSANVLFFLDVCLRQVQGRPGYNFREVCKYYLKSQRSSNLAPFSLSFELNTFSARYRMKESTMKTHLS